MTCASFPSPRRCAFGICLAAFILSVLVSQATGSSAFDHDRSGNLTVVRAAVAGPPVIEVPPADQLVTPGGWAAFSVVAGGPLPVTYQWRREGGAAVAGGTGDTLYFPAVTPALEGRYYVVVTNARGSVTSAMARLFVDGNRNGLPDTWEMTYFGNLQQTASGDFDGDGISNLDEYNQGLNPAVREIVYWVAASGDFGNPANWSRGRLPVEGDTAVINAGTFTLPSSGTLRASRVTVNVPYTAPAGADVRLNLSGKWEFSKSFTLASGRRFAVDGAGAEVTVTGPAVLNGASLEVTGGAKLTIAGLSSFVHPSNHRVDWRASGTNSSLGFSNLTSVTGPAAAGGQLHLQATSFGTLSLPKLASITKPPDGTSAADSWIRLYAGSTGRVAAPLLTAFNDHDAGPDSRLHAENNGVLETPRLFAVKGASLNLNEASQPQRFTSVTNARSIVFHSGTGTPLVSALATVSGLTTLELNRGINLSFNSLSSLASLTGIHVFSGAKARFGAATGYTFPASLRQNVLWEARDSESVLEFTGLTAITGPPTAGRYLTLKATAGGTLSLPKLASITKPADGNTSADSGVRIDAQTTGAVSAPVLASFRDNDTRPNSSITRGSTGILALPGLRPAGITGVTLNGLSLPVLTAPLIHSPTATAITATGATLGGTVTADGGAPITERGVVFSTNATSRNPMIGGAGVSKVKVAGTTGSFATALTNLVPSTGYTFKAYAINAQGTRYTNAWTFTTRSSQRLLGPGDIKDIAGIDPSAGSAESDRRQYLLENALATPPAGAGLIAAPLRKIGDVLEFSYTRFSAADAAGTTFEVQWSDDLETWSADGVEQSLILDDGTHQQMKATVPAGTGGTRFLRIQVTP